MAGRRWTKGDLGVTMTGLPRTSRFPAFVFSAWRNHGIERQVLEKVKDDLGRLDPVLPCEPQ